MIYCSVSFDSIYLFCEYVGLLVVKCGSYIYIWFIIWSIICTYLNKFPKLVNLSKKKDTNLSCEDSNKKNVYHFVIKSDKVSIQENKKVNFEITSFTRESFTFKGFSTDSKDEKRKIKIFGNINPATSFGRVVVEYVDGMTKDFTYEFSCVEE